MDTIQKKSFSPEGARFGLKFNELLQKLRIRYPRAYGLRGSISRSIPVWLGTNFGIVYEVLQDNHDGFAQVHYVLWHNHKLFQVYVGYTKASQIDGQGLFFIENGNSSKDIGIRHYSLFRETDNGPIEEIDNSDVTHYNLSYTWIHVADGSKILIEEIKSISITRFGIYVICKGYQGKKIICFAPNGGRQGLFLNTFRILHFPSWMQSWQPGQENRVTYFSDETKIYALLHDNVGSVKTIYVPDDPDVRFGKTHRWKYNWMPGNSNFIIIEMHNSRAFLTGNTWVNDCRIDFKYDHKWCFMGEGFLTITYAASNDFWITYYTKGELRWFEQKIFETKIMNGIVQIVQINTNSCLVGISGEWFLITKDML